MAPIRMNWEGGKWRSCFLTARSLEVIYGLITNFNHVFNIYSVYLCFSIKIKSK